ncbi:MAG: DUF6178 family protein [Myxococcota bacterium]
MARLRRITRLPAHQRAQALLQQPDCSLLIRCMPPQDLLITYKTADDPQHRTALIQQMPSGQMQRLWDLDLWKHHRIQPQQLADWLQALCDAGVQSVINHLQGLDNELLYLLLKSNLDIYDQYQWENMDSNKTLFTHTPDRCFVLVSRNNNETTFTCLRQFVELLYGENPAAAVNLLLNVIAITPSVLEEQALHWRDARLQDLGFLPIAKWQHVLAYTNPQMLAQQASVQQPSHHDHTHQPHLVAARLQLRLDQTEPQDLLKQAIAELNEQSSQHVARQLLVLTNRIHAAWHRDLGDEKSLTSTTNETLACLQIALQYLQQVHNKPASYWLLSTPVQEIFRLGRSLPLYLAKQLQKSLHSQKINLDVLLHNLETPYRQTLQGLLRKQPQFFQGLAQRNQQEYTPFANLQQLALTAQIATEAAFRLSLLWGKKGVAVNNGLQIKQTHHLPKCDVLLATWLVWALLEKSPCCKPLEPHHLRSLKNRLVSQKDSLWAFTADTHEKVHRCLAQAVQDCIPLPGAASLDQATKRAEQYAHTVLDAVAQEIGAVKEADIDPRFVQTVWVSV